MLVYRYQITEDLTSPTKYRFNKLTEADMETELFNQIKWDNVQSFRLLEQKTILVIHPNKERLADYIDGLIFWFSVTQKDLMNFAPITDKIVKEYNKLVVNKVEDVPA